MYRILGSDGNEYDSLPADKINQWIQEGRVDQKTPVMPEGADNWVFLGDLKEFAGAFAAVRKPNSAVSTKNRWMKMAGYISLFLVVAGITVFFILKKMKYH